MESAIGLSMLGNIIESKQEPRSDKKINGLVARTPINADNVYNSWNLRKNRRKQGSIANDRYKKARKPMETGIVPNFYNSIQNVKKRKQEAMNEEMQRRQYIKDARQEQFDNVSQDSVFSDENSLITNGSYGSCATNGSCGSRVSREIDVGNNMAFFNKTNLLTNNKYHEQKVAGTPGNNSNPGFFSQFDDLEFNNPSDPVSSNNIPHQTGKHSNISRIEMERDIALKGNYSSFEDNQDMTYDVVDKKDFVHNNMVPFFKRGMGKGYGPDSVQQRKLDEMNQRKMERFSGSSKSVEYRPKTERRPLFNPHVGLTNIYGMPNFTNYMETRYIPGRERRNELVHQPVRVTPGLNLGYNEVSKQGFHDTWRALPKTVDELRPANKPKISYGSVVIPGMKSVRRSIIPNVAKRRPITFKENDPRDLVKGTSYYRAPSIYGNYEAPSTNRQMTTRAWYGAVGTDPTLHKPESLYEQHKISHKENFLSDAGSRNTKGVEQEKATTATANSYHLDPTMRQTTENRTYVQPAGPEYKREIGFDYHSNIPDPTMRQTTENRTYQQPAGPEYQKHVGFDYQSNVPDPTMRNTTERRTYQQPAGPEYQKHVAFDMKSNIPDPTMRQTTELRTYQQPAGPEYQKHVAFDMKSNIPDPTMRNTTELRTYQQPTGPEWQKGTAFDYRSNIPDPTMRQTTELRTYQQPAGPEWQKGVAFDMKTNIPDPTLRNVSELRTYQQPAGPEWQKGVAFDFHSNIPDPTIRNTTEIKTYQGPLGPEWQKGGYQVAVQGTVAPTTMRQLTEKKTWYTPVAHSEAQKGAYQVDVQNTVAPTTLRQLTQANTHLGSTKRVEAMQGGYQVAVQNTVAPTTMRQTTQVNSYIGHAGYPEKEKGGYQVAVQNTVAPTTMRQLTQHNSYLGTTKHSEAMRGAYEVNVQNTVAPTTMRQLTQNVTQYGPAGPNDREKGGYQVAVQNTVAPTTLRQLTQNVVQLNPAGPNDREKGGYQVAVQNTVAPTTLRQLTQNTTHYNGPIMHEGQKTRVRKDAENSLVNIAKEKAVIARDGGAPTTCNYEKGPTYEYTMMQLCEPIQIQRDLYPSMDKGYQRPLQCVPTMYTRIPNQLPNGIAWRFDTCITENLKSNPFINNTQHKSVEY